MKNGEYCKRIRAILRALEYTPKTLAEGIGVTIHQSRRIMRDGGSICLSEAVKISEITGIPLRVFDN